MPTKIMEKLFSRKDLVEIEKEALNNLDSYLGGVVIDGKATEKSIITISTNNQLIFVEGNSDSGFIHLRERHARFSFKNYWIATGDGDLKLDNPSKFHPSMMPIIDFVKIADAIFTKDNINISKNKKPELFDLYSGYFEYTDGKAEKYHLLTYKDTKVVHTLFPNNKKNNAKRKCKYGKGFVRTALKLPEGYNDLLVPYEDESGLIVYSIFVRKFYHEKIERLIIQKHDKEGQVSTQYYIGYRKFNDFESFDRKTMNDFQIGDLTEFEKIITEIEKTVANKVQKIARVDCQTKG